MSESETKTEKLKQAVNKELMFLSNTHGESASLVARYRHNLNKKVGEDPFIFGHILEILPEELYGNGDKAGRAEEAAYAALTLYAFAKNDGNGSIADAISRIEQNGGIIQRFHLAETADDIDELKYRMRGIVSLIASKGESFSYSELAAELYGWQYDPASQIRRWERKIKINN
ncbi:MAG: type I-E CRISPR-associated protein Cse2/CasB [Firmicutes bacterium]|nr:type I-E CRISPR-associated protein Cse2/CasB [Bacillota bacterium]